MTQNVSSQYMEAAAKMAQLVARNTNAKSGQNASFQSYMQETGKSRQDVQKNKMDNGRKDVQKQETDKPAKQPSGTETAKNDGKNVKPDDVKDTQDTGENAQKPDDKGMLIDLALMAQMLNNSIVVEVKPEGEESALNGAMVEAATQSVGAAVAEQNLVSVADGSAQIEALVQPVLNQESAQTVHTAEAFKGQAEKASELGKAQQKTNESNVAQTVNQSQDAQDGKKQTQNNVANNQGEAAKAQTEKPQIKVEVQTGQENGKQAGESKAEESQDASVLSTAKAEKPELPVVTVKVGEGGQLDSKAMTEDVADAIIKKIPQGKNEFEIQLNPKDLGKITIKLLFENGQTLVSLSANNAKAASVLSECAKSIGALIQQHTNNETVVTVQEDRGLSQDQQKQEGNRQNAENKQHENAQKQRRQQAADENFVQQMRLGLFETEYAETRSRYF